MLLRRHSAELSILLLLVPRIVVRQHVFGDEKDSKRIIGQVWSVNTKEGKFGALVASRSEGVQPLPAVGRLNCKKDIQL